MHATRQQADMAAAIFPCADKGTLDAVLCSKTGVADVMAYLREVDRWVGP